jgi:hypothetical protein
MFAVKMKLDAAGATDLGVAGVAALAVKSRLDAAGERTAVPTAAARLALSWNDADDGRTDTAPGLTDGLFEVNRNDDPAGVTVWLAAVVLAEGLLAVNTNDASAGVMLVIALMGNGDPVCAPFHSEVSGMQ